MPRGISAPLHSWLSLNIGSNPLSPTEDLSELNKLVLLEELHACNASVTTNQLMAVTNLTQLKFLEVCMNNLTTVVVSHFPRLTRLDMDHNNLTNIFDGQQGLQLPINLSVVYITENSLTEIGRGTFENHSMPEISASVQS